MSSSFLLSLSSVYVIMLLAEFADKTNLIALSLMNVSKRPFIVATGGLLGITITTIIGVALGLIMGSFIPLHLVAIISGGIFILLGILSLKNEGAEVTSSPFLSVEMSNKKLLGRSALLIGFAEFGDKSQVFVFSATLTENAIAVLLGAMLGMATIMYITATFGQQLILRIDEKKLRYTSAVLFILAGIWFIISAFMN